MQRAGQDAGRNFSTGFQAETKRLDLGSMTRDVERLTAASRESTAAEREFVGHTTAFENALTRRTRAIRDYERAHREAQRASGGGGGHGGGGGGFGGGGFRLGRDFSELLRGRPPAVGTPAGLGALASVVGSVAEAVTTASQALWLLPAATAAAGAGFATLKIGVSGFDRALKDMGDPKKFAQDLQSLAPSAQQAALEIQHLSGQLGGFGKEVQEALFAGAAPQLHNLADAFLPQLRGMFTGIAGSFGSMFQGAVGQLTGASRGDINNVISNIVKAFQNLSPAMAPVVDAFAKITQVGSTFLPGLADGITNAAKAFDAFIRNAAQTGQLQHWIQQGLDAAKALGNFISELGHKFYDVFGNKSPQQFADVFTGLVGTLTAVGQAISGITSLINGLVRAINPVANMVGGWPDLIRDVVIAWGTWKVGSTIADLWKVSMMLGETLPAAAEAGAGRAATALGGLAATLGNIAATFSFWDIFNTGGDLTPEDDPMKKAVHKGGIDRVKAKGDALDAFGKDWEKKHGHTPLGGGKSFSDKYNAWISGGPIPDELKPFYHPPAPAGGPGGAPSKWGPNSPGWNDPWWGKPGDNAGMPPWSPYDVPAVPDKKGKGGIGKDKDYTPYSSDYSAPPRPGESEEVYRSEGEVMDARHRLEQDRQTLLNLQKDNNATAQERQEQENQIAKDQRELNLAQMGLAKTQQEAIKKNLKGLKDANDEFNNIDQDLGLSQGLPGLVRNLVGMFADLAAAPLMGQLKAITAVTGTDKDTFGAFGMFGQQNIAAGRSPLGLSASSASYNLPSITSPQDLTSAGAGVSNLYRFAESLVGTPYSQQIRNDCSGMVSRLAAQAVGLGDLTPGERFSTANEGQWLASHGFQPGMGGPGDFNIGWHNGGPGGGHTAATLPGGINAEQGGSVGSFALGGPVGAGSSQFDNHMFLPGGAIGGDGASLYGQTAALGRPGGAFPAQLAGFGRRAGQGGMPGGMSSAAPNAPIGGGSKAPWQPQGGGGAGLSPNSILSQAIIGGASMFPGGGAAAQTAMQLINRTIGYGQQSAAIGIQGALDTLKVSDPDGDGGKSDLSSGWFGRVLAGFAGARPAVPGGAGTAGKKDSDPTKDPTGREALGGSGGSGGDTNHTMYGNGPYVANGNVIINGQPQQPSMGEASASLAAASSAPATTSVMGAIV